MSFDFSTLVTDRTQADVSRVKQIAEKIKNGTASESELAEFNSAAMKGAYNHTDLNRVTAAMEALKAKLEGYGYSVPGYQRIKVPHVLPEPEPTSRLPEGYTELTYIESTGTQYIDTGVNPSVGTQAVVDFQAASTPTSNWWILSAVISGTVLWRAGVNASTFRSDAGFTYSQTSSLTAYTVATGTCSVNMSIPLYLFAQNEGGAVEFGKFKLYSCLLYSDNALVRDYIPCINPDGEVGLYDLVTATFFGNSGTGSFVAGAIPRELPDGYTQVEYIQSSGTQYIDTGFKPNQNTRLAMEVSFDATTQCVPYGARQGTLSNAFNMFLFGGSLRFDYGAKQANINYTVSSGVKYQIDHNKASCVFGGSSTSLEAQTFTCSRNLTLFALNDNGTMSNYTKGKLYSCQAYDNEVLIRDFVPCKNASGVVGLYDIVNNSFYQNAGSGTFTAGEEVVAPVAASVSVASVVNNAEYDPHTWYEFDWPTPETMTLYLLNVSAIRSVFAVIKSTPSVPLDMVDLMIQEANNIEKILVDVNELLEKSVLVWFYSGDLFAGEVD